LIFKNLDNLFNYLPESLKTEPVLKSIADQLKLLAWASGGLNYLLGKEPHWYNIPMISISWIYRQTLVHFILTKLGINKSWRKLE